MSDCLVYDVVDSGHRRNYVEVIARVLGARPLIGPLSRFRKALLDANYLILPTFESAPLSFLLLMILRSLLGKKTAVISIRAHVEHNGRPVWNFARRTCYLLLSKFSSVLLLTITRPANAKLAARFKEIEDLEFWDLDPEIISAPPRSQLADGVAAARGTRKVLLVVGFLDGTKGLGFLHDILSSKHTVLRDYFVVCAGHHTKTTDPKISNLASLADLCVNRYLSQDEILSLYPFADLVWCCYDPNYDVSSGIFGRALQFGRPTIVRAGSILERFQVDRGVGLVFEFGNVDGALSLLAGGPPLPRPDRVNNLGGAAALKQIVEAHASRN